MSGSTLFTDAMALTPVGDGRYDGELNEHWTIGPRAGPKVHGGAMLALCANAARIEHGGNESAHRSGPETSCGRPIPGRCRWSTTVRKRGRRVSLIDVELNQGDRTAVRAAITLGDPEHHVAAAAVGQSGGAVDDTGAAARAGTDRARPPDGRHRPPGARLRHPAVADDDVSRVPTAVRR